MKRVFMGGHCETMDCLANLTTGGNFVIFVAQEDVILIGSVMSGKMIATGAIANDGFIDMDMFIATQPEACTYGIINAIHTTAWWNTTPAGVGFNGNNSTVMFPKDHGITLKEGEVLYLNMQARNDTAGMIRMTCDLGFFYVKGKATG